MREAAEQRAKSGEEAGPAPKPPSKAEERRPAAKRKPVVPLVRVRPAVKQPPQGQSEAALIAGAKKSRGAAEHSKAADGSAEGLEAFLGDYGSDSDGG